jgi:hypothetical protein
MVLDNQHKLKCKPDICPSLVIFGNKSELKKEQEICQI